MKKSYCVFICLLGLVVSDNSTIGDHSITEDVSEINNTGNNLAADVVDQNTGWGEWSPWSKWSACSRTCGGGISRQQRRCRRKPCRGRIWTTKYKICNPEPCEKPSDFRAAQCAAFNNVPYSGQLLKWYPHYDPARPCALICRGVQTLENGGTRRLRQEVSDEKTMPHDVTDSLQFDSDETIVVQLADKVEDGTKCYAEGTDVCISGECMKVGCDLRVGSNKNTDACGVCGGNGSTCQSRYSWSLESISVCSLPCGGGLKIAVAVCKSVGTDESVVEDSYCDASSRPKTLMPCNTHACTTTKWMFGEWSACTVKCGGGTRTRSVFCTTENGNETTKLPDHKCSGTHKPRSQEPCNTMLCPMWETNKWSECSVTCGTGVRTRTIECRDSVGDISGDCDPAERPHTEQECKTNVACPTYGDGIALPLAQPYPLSQVSEKLADQPVPSESTFIAEKWSACSVTCGEGIRRRDVHCKIFLEFSRTIAMLPDKQCSGPKPVETETCTMQPCNMLKNSLPYGVDTVDLSSYVESSLTDSYRSSPGGSGGSGYDSSIKVAPGSDVQTTYSWKEAGYTPCSATCLGGVQDLIINCVRDDTGKTAMPLLCAAETKPEARIRVCNDHPCPPRWNYSEFSTCMSPCGIGIQTRDVTCIHEVTRGNGKTVPVPNYMCPQPPPADRRYCNVWDCPIKWSTGEWGKCSKTCGGGVKKRTVVCEQIMAQGRKQSREERECPTQKPASEKPCNTRTCHESDRTALPIITTQNATYNQTDINAKVDLRIGGMARVFQGTPSIKIRCPVRKFDKTRIIWAKDNKEIRKSRKYKISRKGALKIIDITSPDSGVYACIAGNSRAETQLIVKFRSKEQISSEEYLRIGNSVHLERNANINSAPANSGESLYTDHAAVYGNRFDGEDISHEHAFPNKPTRKPHQKKQKTSPTPSDATMMHKDHTVTSLNQPGYHESAESAAPSSASTIVPHLSYLISSLKAYWPFRSETAASNNHRITYPALIKDGSSAPVVTMKYRYPNQKSGLTYQNIEDPFDDLYRNTVIPDKTFGPDEERIFIDVDPYDLDVSMLELQHRKDEAKSTLDITVKTGDELTAKPDIDYIEESLKNVKRYWQEQRDESRGQWSTTSRDHVRSRVIITEPVTSPGNVGMDVYYVEDSSAKKETPKEEGGFVGDEDKSINHDAYGNAKAEDSSTAISTPMSGLNSEDRLKMLESDRRDSANKTAHDYSDAFDEESDKRKIERHTEDHTTSEYTIMRLPTTRNLENGARKNATLIDDQQPTVVEEDPDEDTGELSRDRGIQAGSAEKTFSDDLKEASKEGQHLANRNKLLANVLTGVTGRDDTTKDPFVELLSVLAVNSTENLVIEWATTEWSECSQTCGGSGFQMRGAQCTIRSVDNGTSTRVLQKTVIDAKLCENAGHPVPQKVRSCGIGRCPQWHATEWTPCETSRCFNWKTAMQKRDISCRLVYSTEDDRENVTLLDPNKCDESTRPPQRQECYNDACKGVWRVGEWSECNANCEEDGIKYRILQCVWFGTKKPAGNACRDIPRPPVMKTCRGPPCPQSAEDCKDHSPLCSRVKALNICKLPLYQKQCCATCR